MYNYKAGFVGAGNMGSSLANAICKNCGGNNVIISCKGLDNAKKIAKKLGCNYGTSDEVVKNSKFVFLGVKPQNIKIVAMDLKDAFNENKECIIVSMIAGVTIDKLESLFGKRKIIRIMPNTSTVIGEGMTLMCSNSLATEELKEFEEIMSMSGAVDSIPEELIDAGTAVSGCGPAFVYMFIDALAEGGIKCGLTKDKALKYASQALLGSAKMVLETGINPDDLKNAVCSPGGSTIEGVHKLEKGNFKDITMDAVLSSYQKTKKLG